MLMNTTTRSATARIVIRSNTRGTVNRAQLAKLAKAGKLQARVWHSYDDMSNCVQSDEFLPVHYSADGRSGFDGHITIRPDLCAVNASGR